MGLGRCHLSLINTIVVYVRGEGNQQMRIIYVSFQIIGAIQEYGSLNGSQLLDIAHLRDKEKACIY
jgi:hypothetical protein